MAVTGFQNVMSCLRQRGPSMLETGLTASYTMKPAPRPNTLNSTRGICLRSVRSHPHVPHTGMIPTTTPKWKPPE